jgi:F-type H+-transporting ATPase subunit alpha
MTELLKQSQYSPLAMEEQVIVLYAGTNGFIDDYPVEAIGRYERELMQYLRTRKKSLLDSLRGSGNLDDSMDKEIREALTEFAKTFSVEDNSN